MMGNSEQKIIQAIKSLTPLSGVIQQVCALTEQANVDTDQLAKVIGKDPVLSSKILQLANSSFYGFNSQVTSINQAVVILGFHCIKNIALSLSVVENTKELIDIDPHFYREIWLHGISTGIIASNLASYISNLDTDEAFIVGLLHDIGKLIMAKCFGDDYLQVLKQSEEKRKRLSVLEQMAFKTDHAIVGKQVCEYFHLPDQLVCCIGGKYDENNSDDFSLRKLLSLSDSISSIYTPGNHAEKILMAKHLRVLNDLDIPIGNLLSILQELMSEVSHAADIVGINKSNLTQNITQTPTRKTVCMLCRKLNNSALLSLLLIKFGYDLVSVDQLQKNPSSVCMVFIDDSLSVNNKKYLDKYNISAFNVETWSSRVDQEDYFHIDEVSEWLQKDLMNDA